MRKYYAERNNLLDKDFSMDFDQLLGHFLSIYRYFNSKEYFSMAVKGVWIKPPFEDEYLKQEPTLAPSPELFFINCLRSDTIWPIFQHYQSYSEEELFTVIEVLHDHIGYYDYKKSTVITDTPKQQYSDMINNVLKWYDGGYYLEPNNGIVMRSPNLALKELFSESMTNLPDDVLTKLQSATRMFYRHHANLEEKRKAINLLADILENIRNELKELLNIEYDVNKNGHDKLIFDTVNNYGIRHNNKNTKHDYNQPIWFDWMMQYYSSTIITFYKLVHARKQIKTIITTLQT